MGPSVWEVVQLDNGLHLKPHSGEGRSRAQGALNCSGKGHVAPDRQPVVKTRSLLPSHTITCLLHVEAGVKRRGLWAQVRESGYM